MVDATRRPSPDMVAEDDEAISAIVGSLSNSFLEEEGINNWLEEAWTNYFPTYPYLNF